MTRLSSPSSSSSSSSSENHKWNVNQSLCCWIVLFMFATAPGGGVGAIKCDIGWGQKGLEYKYGEEWPRDCSKASTYCFRASTQDIKQAQALVDFTWDKYYAIFYFKGCGGTWGTPLRKDENWPYRAQLAKSINITTPLVVTGQGGTQTLDLDYTCTKDFCSPAVRHFASWTVWTSIISVVFPFILTIFMCSSS